MFFLSQKGHIHCLCPILPYNWYALGFNFAKAIYKFLSNSRIPKHVLDSLKQTISVKLSVLTELNNEELLPNVEYPKSSNRMTSRDKLRYYNSQLKWLAEIQSDSGLRPDSDNLGKALAALSLSQSDVNTLIDTNAPSTRLHLVLQGPMDKYEIYHVQKY